MSAIPLRPYQNALVQEVRAAWEYGARNVLMRLDTGGGKTVILSDLIAWHNGAAAVIAHRKELVAQLSMALAALGIRHNIIAAKQTIQKIVRLHIKKYGRSFYDPGSRIVVASVDTLLNAPNLAAWFSQVTLWIVDEGHHVIEDNKWHRVIEKFTHPQCRGLLPTATPSRADGVGLGRGHGGVADVMVQGPPMRWLIEQGYLTDYRMVCVESDLVALLEDAKVTASGDYSQATLRAASEQSHIVGDMVRLYGEWAPGMRAVVFTTDVDTAGKTAARFNEAGFRARPLVGDMDPNLRDDYVDRLESGDLDLLVAVDVVSEGFDLPAIMVAIFGRKTESLATYMQQFGRALRPMWAPGSGLGPQFQYDLLTQAGRLASIAAGPKPKALIIDCVNNFLRHGPPDRVRPWTLEGSRRMASDAIPLTNCTNTKGWVAYTPEEKDRVLAGWVSWVGRSDGGYEVEPCAQPYERFYPACPHCGKAPPPKDPSERLSPAMVDGDLIELSPEILAKLRGEADTAMLHPTDYARKLAETGLPQTYLTRNVRYQTDRYNAQEILREQMALWGGVHHARGLGDREIQRLFFHRFGLDVLSAQALDPKDANALTARIDEAVRAGA